MLVNFDDGVDAGLDVVWAGILEVENVHRVASTFDAQNGCASLLARFFTLLEKNFACMDTIAFWPVSVPSKN